MPRRPMPRPDGFRDWKDWANSLLRTLEEPESAYVRLPIFAAASPPSAGAPGVLAIQVSGGTHEVVFSDGSAWKVLATVP